MAAFSSIRQVLRWLGSELNTCSRVGHVHPTSECGSGYVTVSGSSANKTATLEGYILQKGSMIAVNFEGTVPTNSTLNINNTGAKPITFLDGTPINSYSDVLTAGSTSLLVYDGEGYRVIAVDKTNDLKSNTIAEATHAAQASNSDKATSATYATKIANASNTPTSLGSNIQPVYFSNGVPVLCNVANSGAYWNALPNIRSDGVMEIGKYIDFHESSGDTADYSVRLTSASSSELQLTKNGGGNGNLRLNFLYGTAQYSQWADLAEIYETDFPYTTGTLVTFGGEKEITKATDPFMVHAVVSEKPGFVLNSKVKGLPIALCGRVPVLVVGKVSRFDPIYLYKNGIGATAETIGDVKGFPPIARALKAKDTEEEGLVECVTNFRI